MSHGLRASLNVVWLLAVLAMNYISNALPLNNMTQRDLSALYPIYLTPAPYVFSIWGLIYSGILVYIIVQALPAYRDNPRLRQLDLPFALSCLFNITWIVVWHYRYVSISVLFMLGIFGSLLWAYLRLDRDRLQSRGLQRWIVDSTFSLYLAWVGLATMINISAWLYTMGWKGGPLSGQTWSAVLLGVALTLYLVISTPRRDTAMLGVLAWASYGVQYKHQDIPVLRYTALVVFAVSLAVGLWHFWSNRKTMPRGQQTPFTEATSSS